MLFTAYSIIGLVILLMVGIALKAFKSDRGSIIAGVLVLVLFALSLVQSAGIIGLLPEVTWR